jgi:hypothetical protein
MCVYILFSLGIWDKNVVRNDINIKATESHDSMDNILSRKEDIKNAILMKKQEKETFNDENFLMRMLCFRKIK